MTWEYDRVVVQFDPSFKYRNEKYSGPYVVIDNETVPLHVVLDEMGDTEWEMCGVSSHHSSEALYFKRPKG